MSLPSSNVKRLPTPNSDKNSPSWYSLSEGKKLLIVQKIQTLWKPDGLVASDDPCGKKLAEATITSLKLTE
jgi:hypothetical protein